MMGSNDWVGILALAVAVKVKREGCSGQLSLKDSDVPLCFLLLPVKSVTTCLWVYLANRSS